VFVTLPEWMTGQLRVVTYPAPGGTAGPGGRPGRGRNGGRNPGDPAIHAADGVGGAPGKAGRDGVPRPAPEVFVNGRPFTGRMTSQ
jgi:hypothetical protein